jgi:acetyl esterase/lipase
MARSWQSRVLNALLRLRVKRRLARDMLPDTPIEDARASSERRTALFAPQIPAGARFTDVDADGVRCERIDVGPAVAPRVLLYLHGGGFVFRLTALYRGFAARLAADAGAWSLKPDYALAPEHPFPRPLEDCLAAYRWLLRTGVAPRRIAVIGDSGGANLTLALLIALRDAGDALPACAVALSPPTDMTVSGWSAVSNLRADPLLSTEALLGMKLRYVGGADPTHPLLSPARADLRGLPPVLVHAGSIEVLRDDAVRFAERARAAGVAVELEVWEGMPHVFQVVQWVPEARRAVARIVAFVQNHTA